MGTPAMEARNLIESLVGIPHIDVKTEITLGDVVERLSSLEKVCQISLLMLAKSMNQ